LQLIGPYRLSPARVRLEANCKKDVRGEDQVVDDVDQDYEALASPGVGSKNVGRVSGLGQEAPAGKKYARDPGRVKKRASLDYAAERLPDLEIHVGATTSVDVMKARIDKAYGMRKFMTVLHLTSDDILFFGDKLDEGGNDYPVKNDRNRQHRSEELGRNRPSAPGHHRSVLVVESIAK